MTRRHVSFSLHSCWKAEVQFPQPFRMSGCDGAYELVMAAS